jgi:hypothetical protein
MNRINGKDVRSKRMPKRINLTVNISLSPKMLSSLIFDDIWLTSEGRVEWKTFIENLTRDEIQNMIKQKAESSISLYHSEDPDYMPDIKAAVRKRVSQLYEGK